MPSMLLPLTLCLCLVFVFGGFTKDGGYIGKYPGGCTDHNECPDDENCIHEETEELCPPGDIKNCRCIMGCVYKKKLLRYQQWRPIDDEDGYCMCKSPGRFGRFGIYKDQGGLFKCTRHLDL